MTVMFMKISKKVSPDWQGLLLHAYRAQLFIGWALFLSEIKIILALRRLFYAPLAQLDRAWVSIPMVVGLSPTWRAI